MRKALAMMAIPVVIMAGLLVWNAQGGAHVIDGYHIGGENRCPGTTLYGIDCAVAVPVATKALVSRDPAAVVVRASLAVWACSDYRPGLRCITAGLASYYFVVFDLQDGSRRAIGLNCQGVVYDDSMSVVEAPKCMAGDPNLYRSLGGG